MKQLTKILLVFVSSILLFSNCKKDPEINNAADFKLYLEEEMESQNIPALSALIFKGDQILVQNHLGLSHVQQNISLEQDHIFLLASISKVITGTALLRLYDQGLFSLDDPINNYLPFVVNHPDFNTPITFRHLLTHTGSIADGDALDSQYFYGQDSPVALDSFFENYLVPGGVFYNETQNYDSFEPGTQQEYSNSGSALIGVLVESISGLSFNDFCKQQIFTPMGMTNTYWRLDEIPQNKTIVQPYNYVSGDYEAIQHYTFTDYPNGGLRSTAEDLHKLLNAFAQGGTANNYQLLKPATMTAMSSLQIPNVNNETGLHFFIMNADNNLWGHDGGEQGVATIMAYNKETKIGAILLTNQGDANLDQILVEAYQLGLKL